MHFSRLQNEGGFLFSRTNCSLCPLLLRRNSCGVERLRRRQDGGVGSSCKCIVSLGSDGQGKVLGRLWERIQFFFVSLQFKLTRSILL